VSRLKKLRQAAFRPIAALGKLSRKPFFWGAASGIVLIWLVSVGNKITSSDEFCDSCHIHPHVYTSWQQSTHHTTASGMVIHCVECHLPPGGVAYAYHKARTGIRDVWGTVFKDAESFDWATRSRLEHAREYMFRESCVECHPILFPLGLSTDGDEAHLYYEQHEDDLRCLNCHLQVGHYDPNAPTQIEFGLTDEMPTEIYDAPATVDSFVDYTEFLPGTTVSFEMVAIPGGTFDMGSPDSEAYRREDEGPVHAVTVSPFWMGRVEVTWDEFEAWYAATKAEGRSDTRLVDAADVDALTGATPPYVPPDQGWGKGSRPAITMTHQAAVQYTRWLSSVTGKRYRLPTEAEWEYAARAGTESAYFFEGEPRDYTERRFWNRLLGRNTEVIDSFVVHHGNSGERTAQPDVVAPNPFGLVNMLGNVREFCSDWYAPDTYRQRVAQDEPVLDPMGPPAGTEHVVRGGSFRNDPADLRVAARDFTRREACQVTDPQTPKSMWWYSDCYDVGFRVVSEFVETDKGAER
jgi:formylglycine-generating enzyme required for sulfatase activity/nitrate/TMAO reductase-like tetraheme cytochrome c subunit